MARHPLSGVRAVTFDLDNTLWDMTQVIRHAEARLYAFLESQYPRVAERYSDDDLSAARADIAERRPELRHDVTALRRAALAAVAKDCGYDADLVERAFKVFLDARHEVTLFEDTKPVLERLRRRYVLGTITNGNADVRRLDLGHYFDFMLSPMDVGAAKPDGIIFQAACHRAGFPVDEVAHVGDEPEADVWGAARYGMPAVWINRHASPWPSTLDIPDHVEIRSLSELLELLPGSPRRASQARATSD